MLGWSNIGYPLMEFWNFCDCVNLFGNKKIIDCCLDFGQQVVWGKFWVLSILMMSLKFLKEADSWFGELPLKWVEMHHSLHFRFPFYYYKMYYSILDLTTITWWHLIWLFAPGSISGFLHQMDWSDSAGV